VKRPNSPEKNQGPQKRKSHKRGQNQRGIERTPCGRNKEPPPLRKVKKDGRRNPG